MLYATQGGIILENKDKFILSINVANCKLGS